MADMILSIITIIVISVVLFAYEDKIADWSKKVSRK